MAESLLIKKSAGGLKLDGTEQTLTAGESIGKNNFIDIKNNIVFKANATGSFSQIKNTQFNLPSTDFTNVYNGIPIKNTNYIIVLGTRNGNSYDPSAKVVSFNNTDNSFTAVSSRVDLPKGQTGTTSIQNSLQGFPLNDKYFLIYWSDGSNGWYAILKFENNTLTIATTTTQNFSSNNPSFLVMGNYLVVWTASSSDAATHFITSYQITSSGSLNYITALSGNSVYGTSSTTTATANRQLIKLNSSLFGIINYFQWFNGQSNYNKHRAGFIRVNQSTGALTRMTNNTYEIGEYNYGGAGFQVDAQNSIIVHNGPSYASVGAYKITDTGGSSVGVTAVSNLIDLGTLSDSTYYSSNWGQQDNLSILYGQHGHILTVDSNYNLISKLYILNMGDVKSGDSPGYTISPSQNKIGLIYFDEDGNFNMRYTRRNGIYGVNIRNYISLSTAGIALETKTNGQNIKILKFKNAPAI
jgi:hypothetical protein